MKPAMGIDQMEPALYKAAAEGKQEDYYEALRQTVGRRQVTPRGNTALHVAALHAQKQFVENILQDRVASSMLLARNNNNETVLHCAAERGYADIVSVIIAATKKYQDLELGAGVAEMIRMTDNAKDTALHKAVRMGHLDVVKLLVEEDTEFEYVANAAGETPIYIAAESGFKDCLVLLLDKCQKPTYGGPFGRNALHGAILSGIAEGRPKPTWRIILAANFCPSSVDTRGCTEPLLKREESLCESTDDFGWTPLHYAVELRDHEAVGMILKVKTSAAYICAGNGDEWTTIFHIAARDGNVKLMKRISGSCPDCWDMTNSRSQNVLHEAARSKGEEVIKYIFKSPHADRLVDQKDEDGNSPLHFLAISNFTLTFPSTTKRKHLVFNKDQQTPLDMALEHNIFVDKAFQQGGKHVWGDSRIGRRGNLAKDPIKRRNNTAVEEKHIDTMMKSSDTNTIVATLILGITFAAGFTVPGGYDGNPGSKQGFPVLLQNAAFKAFVVTDTIAFISSLLVILFHINMVIQASSTTRNYRTMKMMLRMEGRVLGFVYYGVIAAFLSGMYATLAPLHGLAVAVLALTSSFFFIVLLVFGLTTELVLSLAVSHSQKDLTFRPDKIAG